MYVAMKQLIDKHAASGISTSGMNIATTMVPTLSSTSSSSIA